MNLAPPPPKTGPVMGTAEPGDLVACGAAPETYYVLHHVTGRELPYTVVDTETGRVVHTTLTHPTWHYV